MATNYVEVVPAYGRDYTSAATVRADWNAGKDFQDPSTGRYLSKRDADADPNMSVLLRYANLRKVTGTK